MEFPSRSIDYPVAELGRRAELVNIRYELTIFHPGPDYAREITLSSPGNGSSNISTTPVLKWHLGCNAETIDLRIARDPAFAEIVHSHSITPHDTQYLVPVNTLINNTTYFWQVRARNMGGVGTYTPEWSFSTTSVGIYSLGNTLPEKFELLQNFPNPFNPSTKIRYNIYTAGSVSLKMFDSRGIQVDHIVNLTQQAGQYEVDWNAGDLSSGTYFYKLTVHSPDGSQIFSDVKRMILVK